MTFNISCIPISFQSVLQTSAFAGLTLIGAGLTFQWEVGNTFSMRKIMWPLSHIGQTACTVRDTLLFVQKTQRQAWKHRISVRMRLKYKGSVHPNYKKMFFHLFFKFIFVIWVVWLCKKDQLHMERKVLRVLQKCRQTEFSSTSFTVMSLFLSACDVSMSSALFPWQQQWGQLSSIAQRNAWMEKNAVLELNLRHDGILG